MLCLSVNLVLPILAIVQHTLAGPVPAFQAITPMAPVPGTEPLLIDSPPSSCDILSDIQVEAIGAPACNPSWFSLANVSPLARSLLDWSSYSKDSLVASPGLEALGSTEEELRDYLSTVLLYYKYNQCYNMKAVANTAAYVLTDSSYQESYYCFYSESNCLGEEVCVGVNNNSTNECSTILPVTETMLTSGIKSTLVKKYKQNEEFVSPITIDWLY
ncbi:hypothetical protein K7432_016359 [Basidiobolus ranarum]|uniref:Uncharacterized protein n=1 Tax=Basidiobolus ranarum TaxID=34480 RepID=A0ABR2WET8_9FUNG